MKNDLAVVLAAVGRFLAYCLLAALPVLLLRRDLTWLGNTLGEASLVEVTQAGFLLATTLAFALLALRRAEDRRFAVLAAAFFACLLIREQDALLDGLLFHGAWKYLAAPLALGALVWALQDVRATLAGLARLLSSRAGTVLLLALAVLLIYSRLLGMTGIWTTVLGDGYVRTVKNAVEETTELLGYTFVLAASVGYVSQRLRAVAALRRRPHVARGACPDKPLAL